MVKKVLFPVFILLATVFGLLGCNGQNELNLPEDYQGPISIATNIHLVNSDSGIVRTELFAQKRLEYRSGDMEFPEGIIVNYLSKSGEVTSKISADRGFFHQSKNLYSGKGNVQVMNFEKQQQLNSEELYWDPNQKKIYTHAFVVIKDKNRIIKGTGMEADDKFETYKIFKSHGEVPIPGDEN